MYSGVYNLKGAKVEQLNYSGTIMSIADTGLLTTTTVLIPLQGQTLYVIDRIKFILTYFNNSDLNTYAFPKFEQFVFGFLLKASLGVTNNAQALQLFSQMQFLTTDGISDTFVFNEPFVFKVDSNSETNLYLEFTNSGSYLNALGGVAVPPAAGQTININGGITLEGYSVNSSNETLGEVVK